MLNTCEINKLVKNAKEKFFEVMGLDYYNKNKNEIKIKNID